MTEVIVPNDLWDVDTSGSIVLWLYKDGSRVTQGDAIADVLVEKVTLELTAPATGVLRIKVEPEIAIDRGDVVATIEDE
jgi:pyruvate/2-oxoglutarate dehydrogenase complex dihydrolipoamide acyltransferase (E2) component